MTTLSGNKWTAVSGFARLFRAGRTPFVYGFACCCPKAFCPDTVFPFYLPDRSIR